MYGVPMYFAITKCDINVLNNIDAIVSVPKINVRLMFFPLFKAIVVVFNS